MKKPEKKTQKAHIPSTKNPIVQMIADKKRIEAAIQNGESLSTLKGIKIVSPL